MPGGKRAGLIGKIEVNFILKNTLLTVSYFVTGFLFLLCKNNVSFIPSFTLKALLIPWLIVIFLLNIKLLQDKLNLLFLTGLIFCWAGDILLEVPLHYADLFVPGLGCFLTGHLMYLLVFSLTPGDNFVFRKGSVFIIPVILYGILLVLWLYKDLGNMKIPVIAYATVILTMLAAAINRKNKVNHASFLMVLSGAILFVLSDSALAINKFGHNFSGSSVIVMVTYILAQYFIVTGYLKQK